MTLGFVTRSRAEAGCCAPSLARGKVAAVCSRGAADAARRGIEHLRRQGVDGLVSFGLGAGLGPAMRPGDLVVADRVVLPTGESTPTNPAWRNTLLAQVGVGPKVVVAGVAGMDQPPNAVEDKIRLFRATCAAVLDGESHIVAEAASAMSLPFLVVRAVVDPAWDDHMGMPDRGFGALSLMLRLTTQPFDMTATWRFARHSGIALEVLQRVAACIPEPCRKVAA